MTDAPLATAGSLVIERHYRATLADLWPLWTTPKGLESWWGPPGFALTVQAMNVVPGGTLHYTNHRRGA